MNAPETALPDGPDAELECYHCGLPVAASTRHYVQIDGAERRMCCIGCEAVARSIVDNGLEDYYRHRDAMPEPQKEALPVELKALGLFDHPDFQKSFVQPIGEHEREASLILEGITCAACVWLNEQHVARQPGVSLVEINYATRRARVRWDEQQIKLSGILAAIQAIGYRAYPYDAERSEQIAQRERRSMLWRVFVAGFGMMQVMMYAFPAYIARAGEVTADIDLLMRWASLVLTLPVVLYSAAPFFQRALRDIRLRSLGMDVPVALGVGSAFVASVWATLTGGGEVYFDSVTMFVFFLLCGRYLEMVARQKAVRGVEEMGKVIPVFAERMSSWPEPESEKVPVSQLVVGDMLRVRPGEVIPVDGVVVAGRSEVNEALLTGESLPVAKTVASPVTGGCINVSSPIVIRAEQVGDSTRLSAIRQLMDRAATEKPRIAQQSDRVARIFIVALLVLATITGIGWYFFDPARALWVFVSVLVVACPCALSLATPTALTVATDTLARMGILITRGHAIETLARARHFVFDKTGTLTHGFMRVEETRPLVGCTSSELLALAVALEQGSEHPVAAALREAANGVAVPVAADVTALTGQGVTGLIAGVRYWLGRPDYVSTYLGAPSAPEAMAVFGAMGGSVVALGREGEWLALFRLADTPRAEASQLCGKLSQEGVGMTMLSGDTPAVANALARTLGIPDAHGAMTPEGKQAFIADLQSRPQAVVAMVGDGVNDAPVLAQAHVSIAMGGGTDLARNQADIVLLSENLAALGRGIDLSRRTLRIIRQNLWWSFAYNFTSVPLAMAGLVTPWMAGIGMAASSLFVVLNALRLQRQPKAG